MSSLISDLAGVQRPKVSLVPEAVSSAGREAVELAAMAGLVLDPWQEYVLEVALGERADGSWAAFEVGLVVGRQNGKGAVLEARELAGLFLDLPDRLIVHSAHQFDTSLEAFMRMEALIEGSSDLSRRVKSISRSHGSEGFRMRDGKRLRYRARTGGGGRGFTADCIIFDEAMDLPEMTLGALVPTLSARPNPQIWYTGSAVDQLVQLNGTVLSRVRARGHTGDEERLAFFEWGVGLENPDELTREQLDDPGLWADANPGFGIRITEEYIRNERMALDPRTFAVERLGVGDWPPTHGGLVSVIGVDQWRQLADARSKAIHPVCFALDVSPDRSWSSVSAAGKREDGLWHVETVDRRRGTSWVPEYIVGVMTRNPNMGKLVVDGRSPAASLIDEIEENGISVLRASAQDNADACGVFYDDVVERKLRHLNSPELETAVRGATSRPLGDAWAWSRKTSSVDISPLVAATLASWGARQPVEETRVFSAWA